MEADVLSVREAAEQLGVSSERVRQLINAGSLPARRSSAGWLLRADAVAERTHSAARAGRPASPRTAWAILCLLSCALEGDGSNSKACAVRDRRLRHHVMHLLSAMPDPANDPERWRLLLASRGRAEQMWAHPGLLPRLCADDRVRAGGDRAAAQIGGKGARTYLSSASTEPGGPCQFPLAAVKGPKSLCLEFESAGNM